MDSNNPVSSSLQHALNTLEQQRKEVSSLKIKSYLLLAGGVLSIGTGIATGLLIGAGIAGGAALIAGFIFIGKSSTKFNHYRYDYKQNVISLVLKSVDDSLEIDYMSGLSERDFIDSQLFTQEPDRYRSEDQVHGVAGKTRFSFSEVHAEYKTVTQTKNGRQEHWHDILKGIVFTADFNKNFNGITVVRPKDISSSIGAWISSAIPLFSASGRNLVQLENPEFSKTFITYSTDQVEARYILTPSLMERLCELNNRCNYTISLSFIDSSVYIAFPLDKDYFEPPVHKSLLGAEFISEDLEVIRFMYNIIRELDLNTRIWTKT
ncbi:DUF3137 domain-containing protein [Pedobacter sp. MC2016-24]|uniref:DUF3137 domain-containing protein n=1 Tax=Pedobacter sp. MC2016-24 TaxID=2780090 RepID=UPI001880F284|nr:DUF3137 domain-containing protein [Pedobacter sp. MC2016-24]MBE9598777.1 DUF3137 domain-containing protein [Pedobacter sp. MC2016-24]